MDRILRKLCILMLLMASNTYALDAIKTKDNMHINGVGDESSWDSANWYAIDKLILGDMPSKDDFSGRFKILWDEQSIYLLVEITDDVLFDQHVDPKHFYWDDDCLEIFIDEDASGGEHQYNFNAFAYHVALDNQVVDLGIKNIDGTENFVLLNDHIESSWRRNHDSLTNVTWELSISVYDDSFEFGSNNNKPVELSINKKLGFMLAYCDNDGSKEREHFIGSTEIEAVNGNKNLGYITADVFQRLTLIN